MKCYICKTEIQKHEARYTRQDIFEKCHSDCLVRLAESKGQHREAQEIQNRGAPVIIK
jgi:hypothetical protein